MVSVRYPITIHAAGQYAPAVADSGRLRAVVAATPALAGGARVSIALRALPLPSLPFLVEKRLFGNWWGIGEATRANFDGSCSVYVKLALLPH